MALLLCALQQPFIPRALDEERREVGLWHHRHHPVILDLDGFEDQAGQGIALLRGRRCPRGRQILAGTPPPAPAPPPDSSTPEASPALLASGSRSARYASRVRSPHLYISAMRSIRATDLAVAAARHHPADRWPAHRAGPPRPPSPRASGRCPRSAAIWVSITSRCTERCPHRCPCREA